MAYHLVYMDAGDDERRQLVGESLKAYDRGACPEAQAGQPGCLDVYLLDGEGRVQGGMLSEMCWRRLGYRSLGEIGDYPPGHAYAWPAKDL